MGWKKHGGLVDARGLVLCRQRPAGHPRRRRGVRLCATRTCGARVRTRTSVWRVDSWRMSSRMSASPKHCTWRRTSRSFALAVDSSPAGRGGGWGPRRQGPMCKADMRQQPGACGCSAWVPCTGTPACGHMQPHTHPCSHGRMHARELLAAWSPMQPACTSHARACARMRRQQRSHTADHPPVDTRLSYMSLSGSNSSRLSMKQSDSASAARTDSAGLIMHWCSTSRVCHSLGAWGWQNGVHTGSDCVGRGWPCGEVQRDGAAWSRSRPPPRHARCALSFGPSERGRGRGVVGARGAAHLSRMLDSTTRNGSLAATGVQKSMCVWGGAGAHARQAGMSGGEPQTRDVSSASHGQPRVGQLGAEKGGGAAAPCGWRWPRTQVCPERGVAGKASGRGAPATAPCPAGQVWWGRVHGGRRGSLA